MYCSFLTFLVTSNTFCLLTFLYSVLKAFHISMSCAQLDHRSVLPYTEGKEFLLHLILASPHKTFIFPHPAFSRQLFLLSFSKCAATLLHASRRGIPTDCAFELCIVVPGLAKVSALSSFPPSVESTTLFKFCQFGFYALY